MHEYRLKKSERDEEIAPSNNEKAQRDMKVCNFTYSLT